MVALGIFGFLQLILWLVIAWRAMRAHEELATALQSIERQIRLRHEERVARERKRARRASDSQE